MPGGGLLAAVRAEGLSTPPALAVRASRSRGFFEPQTPPPAAPTPPPGSRMCLCGVEAVTFSARRDGPHQGRRFWKCGHEGCKFFEWDDEPPRQVQQGPAVGLAGQALQAVLPHAIDVGKSAISPENATRRRQLASDAVGAATLPGSARVPQQPKAELATPGPLGVAAASGDMRRD
eukprot:CAMPEP_0179096604 /NCGR_PEP_ID=MMETSP0796-20121207/44420_1 /TAXON_ID=73915 /ORGANISM="Pyrodinium bahamense, Strain pbaha01" /LENGTH=175 /DNA_ID=CAMNT_0020794329 /DNA_START=1 /DNA_END=526 /DNA_ORIENTATION=+